MQTVQDFVTKLSENDRYQKQIQRSKEAFEFKPFVAEYYQFRQVVSIFRWVLGAFSIITGLGLLYYSFATTMHVAIAAVLAVLILLFIEAIKHFASLTAFKKALSGKFPLLAPVALAFFALSAFLSVNGVQKMYDQMDTAITDHQAVSTHHADSLRAMYDEKIASEKKALADFRQSVTWKGKIDLYNPTTASVIRTHEARITAAQTEKAEQLAALQSLQADQLQTLRSDTDFNRSLWWGISVAVEVAIMLGLLFVVYYDYRVSQEADLLTLNQQRISLGLQDLSRLGEVLALNTEPVGTIQIAAQTPPEKPTERSIGFQAPSPEEPRHPAPKPTQSVPYSVPEMPEITRKQSPHSVPQSVPGPDPFPGLLADIRAGITDYRTLMKRNGVNVKTVKKAFDLIAQEK